MFRRVVASPCQKGRLRRTNRNAGWARSSVDRILAHIDQGAHNVTHRFDNTFADVKTMVNIMNRVVNPGMMILLYDAALVPGADNDVEERRRRSRWELTCPSDSP